MIRLTNSLAHWGTPEFEAVLKQEIEALGSGHLPLQQGLTLSSHVVEVKPTAMILHIADTGNRICAKLGIFYSGIIAGCNCADDPSPLTENPEYCVVQIEIDKHTAAATIHLIAE